MPLPILFIPGLACSARQWGEILTRLVGSRETAVFELPERPGLSVSGHVSALSAKLDSLRWDETMLVGHSLGANLAAVFAKEEPRRAPQTVLVDPTGDLRQEAESVRLSLLGDLEVDFEGTLRGWFERLLGDEARETTRSIVLEDASSASRESVVSILDAYWDYDASRVLEGRAERTSCIDSPGTKSHYSFQRLCPAMRRASLSGVGHWPHLDDPESFLKALESFASS